MIKGYWLGHRITDVGYFPRMGILTVMKRSLYNFIVKLFSYPKIFKIMPSHDIILKSLVFTNSCRYKTRVTVSNNSNLRLNHDWHNFIQINIIVQLITYNFMIYNFIVAILQFPRLGMLHY